VYHQGTVKGSVRLAASVLAVTGAGLFGSAGAAGAAAASTAAASTVGSGPVDYSCSLAPYGQSLAPLSMVAGLTAESSGTAVTVRLVTQPVQLPASTAAALPQLNYLDLAGSAPASGMAGTVVSLAGQSSYLSAPAGGMTQLPAVTATSTIPAAGAGMANVQMPRTIMLTPVGATAKAPLTCTTTSATTVQVAVTRNGTTGGTGAGTSQPYSCAITVGTTSTTASRVPMQLTATRPGTVGSQDAVTLATPVGALGSAFPASAVPMSVTGSAALGGAARGGSIPMTGLADSGNGDLQVTGHWMPGSAGMVRIFAPHRFAARLREQTATMVTVACTATSATTSSTQVMVKVSRTPAAAAASAGATAAPAAAPGAPNTGGGGSLHSASELPLVAGGAAAVLAGLAVTGYAVMRRRNLNH
jgi:hypothetical protein